MFLDEARIAASLTHPNISQIFDLGTEGHSYFIAMEYVHGVDLRRLCSQGIAEDLLRDMILSTMEGTASWAGQAKLPLGPLWRRVVTTGGTTEAGMQHYQRKGFLETFVEGLARSTERARELGDS